MSEANAITPQRNRSDDARTIAAAATAAIATACPPIEPLRSTSRQTALGAAANWRVNGVPATRGCNPSACSSVRSRSMSPPSVPRHDTRRRVPRRRGGPTRPRAGSSRAARRRACSRRAGSVATAMSASRATAASASRRIISVSASPSTRPTRGETSAKLSWSAASRTRLSVRRAASATCDRVSGGGSGPGGRRAAAGPGGGEGGLVARSSASETRAASSSWAITSSAVAGWSSWMVTRPDIAATAASSRTPRSVTA